MYKLNQGHTLVVERGGSKRVAVGGGGIWWQNILGQGSKKIFGGCGDKKLFRGNLAKYFEVGNKKI